MALISPHFSSGEAGIDGAPLAVQQAAVGTADLLERFRALVGVPLDITSWYRTPEHNAEVGGVPNSQHLTGNAADFEPRGLLLGDVYDRVAPRLGELSPFGQLIFYPFKLPGGKRWGHVHLSTRVGTGSVNHVLIVTPNSDNTGVEYHVPDTTLVGELPRSADGQLLPWLVLGMLLVLLLLFR